MVRWWYIYLKTNMMVTDKNEQVWEIWWVFDHHQPFNSPPTIILMINDIHWSFFDLIQSVSLVFYRLWIQATNILRPHRLLSSQTKWSNSLANCCLNLSLREDLSSSHCWPLSLVLHLNCTRISNFISFIRWEIAFNLCQTSHLMFDVRDLCYIDLTQWLFYVPRFHI